MQKTLQHRKEVEALQSKKAILKKSLDESKKQQHIKEGENITFQSQLVGQDAKIMELQKQIDVEESAKATLQVELLGIKQQHSMEISGYRNEITRLSNLLEGNGQITSQVQGTPMAYVNHGTANDFNVPNNHPFNNWSDGSSRSVYDSNVQ